MPAPPYLIFPYALFFSGPFGPWLAAACVLHMAGQMIRLEEVA